MKIRTYYFLAICSITLMAAACNNNKQSKTETKTDQAGADVIPDKTVPANNSGDIQAPDFSDPELKKYYADYTTYLNNVLHSIRNNDEAGTMALFNGEGKKFGNKNEMDLKAKAADEKIFTNWLMSTVSDYKEIVQSDYYKKFNEEYYKKVKENFDKKKY